MASGMRPGGLDRDRDIHKACVTREQTFAAEEDPMNSAVIQLLVLAGIAIFLILRLRSVLGTREGFEKPPVPLPGGRPERGSARRDFEVIEGGPDQDIIDHVPDGSDAAKALAAMKLAEPGFGVNDFLQGARGAYEMILMAFERGDLTEVRPFLSDEVYESFAEVIEERERRGLRIEASFVGLRELTLVGAEFDRATNEAEITVRFLGELTSAVRNEAGEIVEGSTTEIKRQRDVWTFARPMGLGDPNWQLVATGE
jgi:predicted lipid-binding transport protein (Tim44 family)